MKTCIFLSALFLLTFSSNEYSAQTKLLPGFIPEEYAQMLEVTSRQRDTTTVYSDGLPYPEKCRLVYRSPETGLNNRWDLWLRDDSVGIISIRGTVPQANSWSENFFAAMVPAKGSMIIDSNYVFIYKLAEKNTAGVHAGWLTGLAHLVPSIITQINEHYAFGIKDYIIIGHSQGGALSYLLYSYLHYLKAPRIPDDIKFKVYCSAPPKPGNMFYAYDFDYISRGGWGLRVFNSEDWVPQMPVSVQTLNDFSKNNPYVERDSLMSKMTFFQKLIFEYLLGNMNRDLNEASNLLQSYLGKGVYDEMIKKFLPGFPEPEYMKDAYYYPCGIPIVLMPQPGYDEVLKSETEIPLMFKNHMPVAYYYLLEKIYLEK